MIIYCTWNKVRDKEILITTAWKERFSETSKNLIRYTSENNIIEPSK